jgi:RNA polymerase sigma factor (sigma-70 family)
MTNDAELLRRYADEGLEAAFAEVVRRNIDFVYAAALRQARGNTALARDVTQAVFTDLARKAAMLARHEALVGWLHTATRFAAAKALRSEARRKVREREAQAMIETKNDSGAAVDWARLDPVIDAVLGELKERERMAILLRFFEKKSLADVGENLLLSEAAARSCVDRALEKMRARLARRGVDSTAAALTLALANQVGAAAPTGFAALVTSGALASAVGGAAGAFGLATFIMNNLKTGIAVALLVAALLPAWLELRANQRLATELGALGSDRTAAQAENAHLMTALEHVGAKNEMPNESAELQKLRARAAQLRTRPEGVVDAEMKAPTNAGWSTPAAAFETLNWAVVANDWETFAQGIAFRGETKAKAEAFFAGLSAEAREKYRTPEGVIAHGVITSSFPPGAGWMTAMQVYDTQIIDGPSPILVRIWQRLGSGKEIASVGVFERAEDGRWVAGQEGAAKIVEKLIPLLDPQTGELRPK